jgi:hypothetical protein
MITVRTLSERIESQIKIHENDVTPQYSADQREIKGLANWALDILVRDVESWTKKGKLRKFKKTRPIFIETLKAIKADLNEHQHWSFWHFGGICFLTCFAYEKLLNENKHKSIDLSKQETWASTGWEEAVLAINYVTGKRYPNGLQRLVKVAGEPDVNSKTMCEFILKRISMLR